MTLRKNLNPKKALQKSQPIMRRAHLRNMFNKTILTNKLMKRTHLRNQRKKSRRMSNPTKAQLHSMVLDFLPFIAFTSLLVDPVTDVRIYVREANQSKESSFNLIGRIVDCFKPGPIDMKMIFKFPV